ncbi:hypothetical protein [Nonomuraea sp. NPDC003804]|uniref:hypothetical protein n=1 Tax=Nonomuraea sp. NPDC003804 TaxID=3154547 RepID=UPI0033A0835F
MTDENADRLAAQIGDRLLRGVRISVLAVAVTVQFSLSLPELLRNSSRYAPLWPQVVAFALFAVVAVGSAAFLARGGRIPHRARPAGVCLALLAVAAAAGSAPPGSHLEPADWYFGLAGWHGVLLLFDLRLRFLAAFLGATLVLTVVKMVAPGMPDLRAWAAMAVAAVSVYGFQLALGLLAHGVQRISVRAREAAAEEERIRTEEETAEHRHRDHQRRYAALLPTLVPLLAGLGYGSLDPAHPDVRRRSAHEAARMRRMFAESDDVPDPLMHELQAVIEVAERRGVAVRFAARGVPSTPPKEVRRELIEPVSAMLAAVASDARVTLVRASDQVRVSAVGDAQDHTHLARRPGRVKVHHMVTEDRAWVETVWQSR